MASGHSMRHAAIAPALPRWSADAVQPSWLVALFDWKPFLVFVCLLPAVGLLLTFLAYPLGLGIWLAFTDTTIGRSGQWIGLDNFEYLFEDKLFWQAVFFSVFYTGVATVGKFGLGLWLALLLNNRLPLKSILRAIILLPWIVPTVLSAIAFWWIYDPQFSIISYIFVDVLGVRSSYFDFLGSAWPARWSLIAANVWRGIPFVAISLLAGLQTISPSLYEAALIDGATGWQRFRHITFPLLRPLIGVQLLFGVIYAVYQFSMPYVMLGSNPGPDADLMMTMIVRQSFSNSLFGFGAAASVLLMLAMLIWVAIWYAAFKRDLEAQT